MSLRERSPGVWQIRAYAGTKPNGKALYVYKTFKGTKSEARKEEMLLKAHAGVIAGNKAKGSITFMDYAIRYLSLYVESHAAPSTLENYNTFLRTMVFPHIGHLQVCDITHEHVQMMFNALIGKGYAPSTLAKTRSVLSGMFARAIPAYGVTYNPVRDIRHPKPDKAQPRSLTSDEIDRFIKASSSEPLGPLYVAAILTGMRRSELTKLTWDNIDFARKLIKVREGGCCPGKTKSKNGIRDIAIRPTLYVLLNDLAAKDEAQRMKAPSWNMKRLVFTSRRGNRLSGGTDLKGPLQRILKRASIDAPQYTLHRLRHAHGSFLVTSGVPITDVAGRLGDTLQTVVKTYLHSDGRSENRIDQVLNEVGMIH